MGLGKMMTTRAPASTLFIRLMVGIVFLTAGFEKFLFPEDHGVGYFTKLGIPYPQFMAPLDGIFEILCGALIVLGLFTRLATIPLLFNISYTIFVTKLPLFMNQELLSQALWTAAHDSRSDFCMFLGLLFLLIVGAGPISFDYLFSPKKQVPPAAVPK
jgi:putative oxidoreductase